MIYNYWSKQKTEGEDHSYGFCTEIVIYHFLLFYYILGGFNEKEILVNFTDYLNYNRRNNFL